MFENVISLEYQKFTHDLLLNHYNDILSNQTHLRISFFQTEFNNIKQYYNTWKKFADQALDNHLNILGNQLVYKDIIKELK